MTEQHYTVVADRDKGDDPTWRDVREGDRVTVGPPNWENGTRRTVVRIERPVPTTDEPPEADATPDEAFELGEVHGYDKGYADGLVASPHPPTREQIAEAIYTVRAGSNQNWHRAAFRDDYLKEADAVLALLQKGADQ